jgi:hypothetical protein
MGGALIGEDPHVALGAGEGERLGQGGDRAGLLPAGRQGQRLQRLDLDAAARPLLDHGQRLQPLQQLTRLVGPAVGEQHPHQHQMLRLPGIARLVAGAKAALLRPGGGCRDVALGQQQPRPLRRNRVERAGHLRARRGPLSLAYRFQGAGRITGGLLDPRQRRQAGGQRRGVDEPPA